MQQVKDRKKVNKIIDFLCSESGSHDYTINRREARDELGLQIEKPNDELYLLIKRIYDNIREELQLNNPFNPMSLLGTNNQVNYSLPRCLIESISGGSDRFISEGILNRRQVPVAPNVMRDGFEDQRTFEGWRHQ
jgi:hypothetical protein